MRELINYEVTAQIVFEIDHATVWEGTFAVSARNKREAIRNAQAHIENTTLEFDARIQPCVHMLRIEREA